MERARDDVDASPQRPAKVHKTGHDMDAARAASAAKPEPAAAAPLPHKSKKPPVDPKAEKAAGDEKQQQHPNPADPHFWGKTAKRVADEQARFAPADRKFQQEKLQSLTRALQEKEIALQSANAVITSCERMLEDRKALMAKQELELRKIKDLVHYKLDPELQAAKAEAAVAKAHAEIVSAENERLKKEIEELKLRLEERKQEPQQPNPVSDEEYLALVLGLTMDVNELHMKPYVIYELPMSCKYEGREFGIGLVQPGSAKRKRLIVDTHYTREAEGKVGGFVVEDKTLSPMYLNYVAAGNPPSAEIFAACNDLPRTHEVAERLRACLIREFPEACALA